MFLGIISDITNGFIRALKSFISWCLCGLAQLVCRLVNAVEDIYLYLLGTKNLPENKGTLFEQIFNNETIKKYVITFISVAGALWVICLVVSLIKGMLNQDTPGATKKALVNSFKAIIGIVVIPVLCYSFFLLSMRLINYAVTELNGEDSSIASQIWNAGYGSYKIDWNHDKMNTDFFNSYELSAYPFWNIDYDKLNDIEIMDGYGNNFFSLNHNVHFDYFVVIIGGLVLFICMAIATIKLCGRLINIVILYLVSPVVVSTMSVDDGKRFEAWKEVSISKLFSVMGSVLAMYIYIVLLQVVGNARDSIIKQGGLHVITGIIFWLVCAISGALMVIKGSDMLDSIVSQNAGGQDGLSPMGMASLGRVLGRGIGKAKGSLFGKPSAKGGNGGAGGGANSGGNGTFNKTGSTGAWGSLKNAMGNSPMGKALNSIKQNGLIGAGVNAVAGIGTGIKDNHQINQELKDVGFKHPNFHPILKHEQKQAIKKDRQQLQNLKNQGVNKADLQALKKNRLGSTEFRTQAIALANKHKKEQEKGVYR